MNNKINKKIILFVLAMLALTTPAIAIDAIVGETVGYTAVAGGDDGDIVKVVFDWGDGTQTITAFVPLGTSVNQTHVWEKPGVYEVKAKAVGKESESKWFTLGQTNVLASNPNIFVWLIDADGKQISGTVDRWHDKVHIEKTVGVSDPLEYKLEPGNYTIRGRADGYQNMEYSFEVTSQQRRPLTTVLKMKKMVSEPIPQKIPGFEALLGICAIGIAISLRNK